MDKSAQTVSPSSTVARAPGVLMVEVDGETVLMSVEKGSYFGLAATAQDIWIRLERKTTAGALCAELIAAYDGETGHVESETLGFLNEMAAAGLITAA